MNTVFCEFTETERQAVAEGLRLLMEKGGFSDEYGHNMTVNEIDDLILEILNA